MDEIVEGAVQFRADEDGWQALFAAIDRRDAPAFAAFLTPDAEFRFGNAPPVFGRPAIARAVGDFFGMIAACRHRGTGWWQGASSAVCEGQVSYTVPSGKTVTLPFVNVLDLTDAGVSSYRIYIDNGPLLAAVG